MVVVHLVTTEVEPHPKSRIQAHNIHRCCAIVTYNVHQKCICCWYAIIGVVTKHLC